MEALGINKLLHSAGLNRDVVNSVVDCYERYKDQPADHVSEMQGCRVYDQCEALFKHLASRVRYKEDKTGEQLIKSPARLLYDGVGDCKSMAMYFCCCLHCLGVPHRFRFVNFDGGEQYTHVYAVAIDEDNNEIILDAVEVDKNGRPIFNFARPYAKKKDYSYYE